MNATARSACEVAREVTFVVHRHGYSHQAILSLVSRYNDIQSANDRPISGRLPVATHRQHRLIVISHLWDTPRPTGHTSAVPPGRNNPRFSKLTVRRRFHSSYLSGRRSHRGPVLSPLHHLEGDHTGVRSSALSTIRID